MIEIDGSKGEGGGQIVRSSLTLAAITGKAFTIENVRAQRKRPGLKRQHLTAVNAVYEICGGKLDGAELNSGRLMFAPGKPKTGDYHFRIGTAGSSTLVAQTVLPIFFNAEGASKITVEGGTHNPMAPCFDFLAQAYLPLVKRMGPSFDTSLMSYGFYPAGGGKFEIMVHPCDKLNGIDVHERGKPTTPKVTAIVSSLPLSVGQRECDTVCRKMGWPASACHVHEVEDPRGPGNALLIELTSNHVTELFTGLGAIGVRAEQVARNVLKETKAYLAMDNVPVGLHLADQLMLPMGLAAAQGQTSSFVTMPLTQHSMTHKDILQRFLDIKIDFEQNDRVVKVTLGPK